MVLPFALMLLAALCSGQTLHIRTLAGSGVSGSANGVGTAASFSTSGQGNLAVDSSGNVYVADTGNSRIRKITPNGTVTTLAGSGGYDGDADGIGGSSGG